MSNYQVVVTDQTLNALLEARLAGLGVGGGTGSPNVVTLEQFGSFAGGVADATIDTAATLAAYAALAALGGGRVELYHSYATNGTIHITGDQYSNIRTVGKTPHAGWHSISDNPVDDGTSNIWFQGASAYSLHDLYFENVEFSGNSIADYRKCVTFSNCTNVWMDQCRFMNNAVEGLALGGQNTCSKFFVTNGYAENVGRGVQNLSAYNLNSDTALLANSYAVNCGMGCEQDGRNFRGLGNHFENCTASGFLVLSTWASWLGVDGITILSSANVLLADNTYINCRAAMQTGDTTGHTIGSTPVPGNQGRLLINDNTAIRCGELFAGGADSFQVVVIRGNYADDAPDGSNYCITAAKGHFVIEGNTFKLGPTSAWAGVVRIGDQDPVNTSGIVRDNVIDGRCWTTNLFVLGPEVTLGHNDILNVPVTAGVYYAFAGTALTTDGALSAWTYVTDTWMPQSDPDFYYSPNQPSRIRTINVPPPKGNWKIGDRADNIGGSGTLGWRCIVPGTADTIKAGVTATTTSGLASVTFAGTSKITKYQWITITGVSGRYQIIAYDPSTGAGTLSANATATVAAAAVAFSAPTWEVTGTLTTRVVTTTATITAQDQLVSYSAAAPYTMTLPPASQSEGHIVRFAKSDTTTNAVTIAAAGSDTINGASTFAPATTQYQITHFYCIGGVWYAHDDASGGGGGAVSTVFGRSGAVTAQPNDYSYAQLSGKPTTIAGISSGVATDFVTQLEATGDARYIQQGAAIPDSEITDSPFFTISAPGATPAAVWTSARRQQVMTLTQNAALTVSGIPAGGSLLVRVIQAASGGPYTLTHAVSGLGTLFPDLGVTPVMSSGAGKFDDYLYRYDGTRTVYARVLTGAG